MHILVLVKQTLATEAAITLDAHGKPSGGASKKIVNPYDEFALEEALRLREKHGGEVRAITLGPADAEQALRQCLAMGADSATRIDDAGVSGDDLGVVAKLLAAAARRYPLDLVLAGKLAIDDGASQVPGRVAELLDLPFLGTVSKVEVIEGGPTPSANGRFPFGVRVHREADGGTEVLRSTLPAVITAEKGLNEPRYPKLPDVLKAKKKEIETLAAAELDSGALLEGALEVVEYRTPPPRSGATMLTGSIEEMCDALIDKLRNEAKVL